MVYWSFVRVFGLWIWFWIDGLGLLGGFVFGRGWLGLWCGGGFVSGFCMGFRWGGSGCSLSVGLWGNWVGWWRWYCCVWSIFLWFMGRRWWGWVDGLDGGRILGCIVGLGFGGCGGKGVWGGGGGLLWGVKVG